MLSKVIKAINDYSMIEKRDRVCVALSGGCDSVALLKALSMLKKDFEIEISAVHINHNLRAEESLRDQRFCEQLCKEMGVCLRVHSVEVDKMSGSTELNARNVRYEIFDKMISDGFKVATAHTSSDNAETVIYNITRGSLLTGVCGIPPVRGGYIRPLIYCTREETEGYADNYVVDSSNLSDLYNRNIIRHKVVPVLKSINSQVDLSISRMSTGLREVAEYMDIKATEAVNQCAVNGRYDCKKLKSFHPAIIKAALAKIIEKHTGTAPDNFHINGLYKMLYKGSRMQLDKGLFAQKCRDMLSISNESSKAGYEIILEKTQYVNNLLINEFIDCDKIVGEMQIRFREQGDSIKLCGRPEKTLKKLFNELAIPLSEREVFPILVDEKGVIFVPFAGIAQRVASDENSRNLLKAKVVKNDK